MNNRNPDFDFFFGAVVAIALSAVIYAIDGPILWFLGAL